MRQPNEIFHPGELDAQRRFNGEKKWSKNSVTALNQMFKVAIDDETAYIIENQKYFFIATSSNNGECDCSFRGTEKNDSGKLLQSIIVIDPKTLVFPDYSGNKIYNSIGNIISNPNIGMLFIDFNTALRIRINGAARIIENKSAYIHVWAKALRYIEVKVKQVYFNCPKRIKESIEL